MTERVVLGMNGRPVHSGNLAEKTVGNGSSAQDDDRDPVAEVEWHVGASGPLGCFERAPDLWLVVHGVTGQVVGCAESRNDALFLIAERHATVRREATEQQERREEWRERQEEWRERYYQKKGTW
jgi:hypothetical protein